VKIIYNRCPEMLVKAWITNTSCYLDECEISVLSSLDFLRICNGVHL